MFLVRYLPGMLGIALCVIGVLGLRTDCRAACGTLAAVDWEPEEILPGLAGLVGGLVSMAFSPAGAAQPPPAPPVPSATSPPG
ncbi:hypothetical protein [Paracoccus sp. N5]|uniref:hypothetical protein n=1 Tax=Paracoccus sp. N5 TaxID=1101189 RepID=UPI00037E2B59|nr:hypothetical protein [Paracoccus sp. N5]